MIVAGVVGLVEVVAQVFRDQDGHQLGGGHRRGRVAGLRHRAGTNGVDPQLLRQLMPGHTFGRGARLVHLGGRMFRRGGAGIE
jgi:hypothetical protein